MRLSPMRLFAIFLTILLFGLAGPVRADDTAAAKAMISAQAEAFGRDDAATAYSFASPLLHELFPQAEMFMGMVRSGFPPVYRHKRFEFGETSETDGKIAQRVNIIDADGVPWEALYTVERQDDGTLKITSCTLLKQGLAA